MQLTSSQRWAIGAVGLAALIACSPQNPNEAPAPKPNEPTLSSGGPAGDIISTPPSAAGGDAIAPGFAGRWAAAGTECSDPGKVFNLSAHSFAMPSGNAFAISKVLEEHPTGRSAVFTVSAHCTASDVVASDSFTLTFGAADTMMQLQLNDQAPVLLVRCP
jgi:hypothetical protein